MTEILELSYEDKSSNVKNRSMSNYQTLEIIEKQKASAKKKNQVGIQNLNNTEIEIKSLGEGSITGKKGQRKESTH